MKRLINEHCKRVGFSLDGGWIMQKGLQSDTPDAAFTAPVNTVIPSVHEFQRGFASYEGAVWYQRSFYFEGGCLLLHFGAVMTECRVYLDGQLLGEHYGGFCEFEMIKGGVAPGEHTLTLMVDNSFDGHSIPQTEVDWYHHGGIIRSVTAQRISGVAVRTCNMIYTLSEDMSEAEVAAMKAGTEVFFDFGGHNCHVFNKETGINLEA